MFLDSIIAVLQRQRPAFPAQPQFSSLGLFASATLYRSGRGKPKFQLLLDMSPEGSQSQHPAQPLQARHSIYRLPDISVTNSAVAAKP